MSGTEEWTAVPQTEVRGHRDTVAADGRLGQLPGMLSASSPSHATSTATMTDGWDVNRALTGSAQATVELLLDRSSKTGHTS